MTAGLCTFYPVKLSSLCPITAPKNEKPTRRRRQTQLLNDLVDKKDYTSLKREAENSSTCVACNRRETSKTCFIADN